MAKKRKKSPQAKVASSDPTPSQPALSEEAAAAIVEAKTDVEETKPEPVVQPAPAPAAEAAPVAEAAPAPAAEAAPVAEAAPEPEPTPAPEAAPVADVAPVAPIADSTPPSEAPESVEAKTARPKKKVVRKKKRSTKPPPVTREALDQKIDRLEAKLEEKKEEAAKAAREGFGSNPAIDDTSVPPVDLEIHDDFFAAGEHAPIPPKDPSGAYTAMDARHAQKMSSHARARRAHLSRYVMWAVGAAAGILLLGVAIKNLRGRPSDEPVRHEVTHAAAAPPAPEEKTAPVVEQAPPPVAETSSAKTDDKTDTNAAEAKPDAAVAEVAETEQPKGDLPPEKPKNAWQEKQAAKAALERGSNGAAIAAGERSVALDATDAEAWLVLGAAYQAMGNVGQAKRAFKSCIAQGKKGPVSDCRDMLSSL